MHVLACRDAIELVIGELALDEVPGATGGDPTQALAAYYQGLESVQAHGLLPETQRYVETVLALRSRFGGP